MIEMRSHIAEYCDAVPDGASSYPGGKSGAGVFQRLINLIPRHRILIVPFAGHCGIVRNIRPAEHTVVIDANEQVCQWWDDWRRMKAGRALEIHHCDGIEWLRFRFGATEYSASGSRDAGPPSPVAICGGTRATHNTATPAGAVQNSGGRPSRKYAAEAFIFCDPPYVLSERSHGRIYENELSDADHLRFIGTVTQILPSAAAVMVCGYACGLYAALAAWRSIDHRVPTRGGLQDERIWLNYPRTDNLHDFRYVGDCRRSRERIRRRQKNWLSQLLAMGDRERAAMLEVLNAGGVDD